MTRRVFTLFDADGYVQTLYGNGLDVNMEQLKKFTKIKYLSSWLETIGYRKPLTRCNLKVLDEIYVITEITRLETEIVHLKREHQ